MNNKKVRQMLTSINPYLGYTIGLLARAKNMSLFEVQSGVNPASDENYALSAD